MLLCAICERLLTVVSDDRLGRRMKVKGPGGGFWADFDHRIGRGGFSEGRRSALVASVCLRGGRSARFGPRLACGVDADGLPV
jgi:hypothetical protein